MSTMMSPKTCFDIGTRCNTKEQEQISSGPALVFIGLYLWILPNDVYILRRTLNRWKLMKWHLVPCPSKEYRKVYNSFIVLISNLWYTYLIEEIECYE